MKTHKKKLTITIIVFLTIYALISIVNHYNFRTYSLDLGLYTNALYNYSHLAWNNSSLFKDTPENLLSSHFDLYLVIFSPLQYIFGTYSLLIIQLVFIIIGGLGVYKYISIKFPDKHQLPYFSLLYFYSFYGIFSAISHDYHSIVIASSILPWFFVFFQKQKFKIAFLVLFLLLLGKESISIWMFFICIALLTQNWKKNHIRNFLILSALFSLLYFVLVTNYIMPYFSSFNRSPFEQFSAIGTTIPEMLGYFTSNWNAFFDVVFSNHTNDPNGNFVKLELYVFLLISGGYLLLYRPHYIIMLIPVFAQKLMHNNVLMWSVDYHYSIEYAPIFAIAIFSIIGELKKEKISKILPYFVLIGALLITVRLMDNTTIYTDKTKIRVYQKKHYQRNYDVNEIHKLLNDIPSNVSVSSLSPFLPHLALREKIYQFPIIKDAEIIVYSEHEEKYPLKENEFNLKIKNLLKSGIWMEEYSMNGFHILKRTTLPPQ